MSAPRSRKKRVATKDEPTVSETVEPVPARRTPSRIAAMLDAIDEGRWATVEPPPRPDPAVTRSPTRSERRRSTAADGGFPIYYLYT